jgi:hypothetical protein
MIRAAFLLHFSHTYRQTDIGQFEVRWLLIKSMGMLIDFIQN